MVLEAGTVTVNDDKTVTGTGLAKLIAESTLAGFTSIHRFSPSPQTQLVKDYVKTNAETLAAAIVEYIKSNAEVTVTVRTTDAGLQRTPNPNDPNTATLGPSADVELQGVIT